MEKITEMDSMHLTFPGERNVRPLIFKNQLLAADSISKEKMEAAYPWLKTCNYKIIKKICTPNGDFLYELGKTTKHALGTITIVIEIFNENQPPIS